jgi:hypothetical protein
VVSIFPIVDSEKVVNTNGGIGCVLLAGVSNIFQQEFKTSS